jgi:hypothetical protein
MKILCAAIIAMIFSPSIGAANSETAKIRQISKTLSGAEISIPGSPGLKPIPA